MSSVGPVIFSGLVSAVVSAMISIGAGWWLDQRSKKWALKIEAKRHSLGRLIEASDSLRRGFYGAVTQLQFHALEIKGLEAETAQGYASAKAFSDSGMTGKAYDAFAATKDNYARRVNDAIVRYNEKVALLQAEAGACVASLDSPFIPSDLYERAQALFVELTDSITSDSTSVEARIKFFMQRQAEFKAILSEVESLVLEKIKEW
jgi:hypothetical protein